MILITGGAGYIGSHVNKLLHARGYETVVFDNLVYGHRDAVKWGAFFQGDLGSIEDIRRAFSLYPIDAVMHFAAFAYVGESVLDPAKYYRNNVANTLNLLDVMRENGCGKFVFSSSCATYGVPDAMPITEDMPQTPISPYGMTKLTVERILRDYAEAYGLRHASLRYFNAAGADPDGEIGEFHDPETHLIPLILYAASGLRNEVRVFGTDYDTRDGTCIRDYIHVTDLADAHVRALAYLDGGGQSDCFNLGNAKGTSVREAIDSARRITKKDFRVALCDRRPGDPPILLGSSQKAQDVLGWAPQYADIDTIVGHAWQWLQKEINEGNVQ